MRTLTLLALALGISLSTAHGSPEKFAQFREGFRQSHVPFTYDLNNSLWHCESSAGYGAYAEDKRTLFHFYVSPVNHRMLQSQFFDVPEWLSLWYSEYMGLRNSVAMKTNDFLADEKCTGTVFDCATKATNLLSYIYLRQSSEAELYVEWTTPHERLTEAALSRDEEAAPGQKAFMYSKCVQTN